jgi:SMI1/KNR4 family protein SUKH-1
VWTPLDARPFGRLDEGQLSELEARLERALPPAYRRWLAETNGLQPIGDHGVRGLHFTLFEQRPLLGVHPDFPPFDLAEVDRRDRRMWLSRDYVVIGVPSGGLLAVRASAPNVDQIVFLPESAATGPATDAAHAARERHLVVVAPDLDEFLDLLQPVSSR